MAESLDLTAAILSPAESPFHSIHPWLQLFKILQQTGMRLRLSSSHAPELIVADEGEAISIRRHNVCVPAVNEARDNECRKVGKLVLAKPVAIGDTKGS